MHPALLKDTLDLLLPNERTRGIVDRDIASIGAEIFQTSADGILSSLAASDILSAGSAPSPYCASAMAARFLRVRFF